MEFETKLVVNTVCKHCGERNETDLTEAVKSMKPKKRVQVAYEILQSLEHEKIPFNLYHLLANISGDMEKLLYIWE